MPASAVTVIAPASSAIDKVPNTTRCTAPHSANAHSIGCRVMRSTPIAGVGESSACAPATEVGLGVLTEATNSSSAGSISNIISTASHCGAIHNTRTGPAAPNDQPSQPSNAKDASTNSPRNVFSPKRATSRSRKRVPATPIWKATHAIAAARSEESAGVMATVSTEVTGRFYDRSPRRRCAVRAIRPASGNRALSERVPAHGEPVEPRPRLFPMFPVASEARG